MLRTNPLYKFSILSFLFIAFLTISIGFIVSHYFKKIILSRELRITTDFVQAHARERLTSQDFSYPSNELQQDKFATVFQDIAKMPEILSVKVYNKEGTILWSDKYEFVGRRFLENEELQQAINGKPIVTLEPARRPDHAYLKGYAHNIMEVYVPIFFENNTNAAGIVSTYKTSTALLGDIKTGMTAIWVVSITGGLLLYLSLFGVFYRAHKAEKTMSEGIIRLNRELSAFNRIAAVLSRTIELDVLLKDALYTTLEVLKLKSGWILIFNEETDELVLAVHKGLPDKVVKGFSNIKVTNSSYEKVIKGGDPIMGARLSEHPGLHNIIHTVKDMDTCATIPLKSMDKVLGVMEVMCPGGCGCELPLESYELFSTIGHQIGTVIAKSLLYREVKIFKERLEDMVEEKTKQVIQMEKLSAIGELMGEIAHQINNPLVGVVNFAQVALMDIKEDHPLRETIETIKKAGIECKEIIQRLLAFSRQSKFALTPTEINPLIDEALSLIERQFSLKKIAVEKRYAEKLPHIMLDATLMRQAVFNIINNARQSMPGGGRLMITTSFGNSKGDDEWIEIGISDTGSGIKKENISKVFSPFFTTKTDDDGIGLGLSVVQDIVNRHRGKIMVESKEGVGATFTIALLKSFN
ncbi:MAG: hypothetical protein HZC45_05555 [Deltaproteobacteria bacterium]|nr:hypothetical protein [Deltaproteobacteria bacterium]